MTTPRLGFVGLGWIGSARLQSLSSSGSAVVAALCDENGARLSQVARGFHEVPCFQRLEELLRESSSLGLDGVVVATPNSLHSRQSAEGLSADLAVFCQKPLSLTRKEAELVVKTARERNRLLGVDYTYRFTECSQKLRDLLRYGVLGEVLSIEGAFHNAYGPDKAWCYDPVLSGGGAFIDLGIHLVDLILWLFDDRDTVPRIEARLYREGRRLNPRSEVEDFADVVMELEGHARARLVVSWKANVGRDCRFQLALLGSGASALLKNVGGSFYKFELLQFRGRESRRLCREGPAALGLASADWAARLSRTHRFDPSIELSLRTAEVIDQVYQRG